MRESAIEKHAVKVAKDMGIITLKLNGEGHRGYPDRLFLKDGKVLFAEFKSSTGRLKKIQEHTIKKLTDAGFPTLVGRDKIGVAVALVNYFREKDERLDLPAIQRNNIRGRLARKYP